MERSRIIGFPIWMDQVTPGIGDATKELRKKMEDLSLEEIIEEEKAIERRK